MNCPNCGADVAEGKKFCSSCGTPVASTRHCPNCGTEVAVGEAFCANCGARQGERSGAPVAPTMEPHVATPLPLSDIGKKKGKPPRLEGMKGIEFKGIGARFFAALIDAILYMILAAVVASRFGSTTASTQQGFEFNFNLEGTPAAITYLVWGAYYVLLEGFLGGTIGKLVLGIRVVNGRGKAPGLVPALIRNLLRIVDFLPFAYILGIVLVATSSRKQRLGDRVANTFVVSRSGSKAMQAAGAEVQSAGGGIPVLVVALLVLLGGGYFAWSNNMVAGIISGFPGQQAAPTQAELGGAWDGAVAINSASLSGVSDKDQQAFQDELRSIKDKQQPVRMEFAPSAADAGTVTLAGSKAQYRIQGGAVVFDMAQGGGTSTFEGRVNRKDNKLTMEGTFKSSGKERGGTVTMQGVFNLTKGGSAAPVTGVPTTAPAASGPQSAPTTAAAPTAAPLAQVAATPTTAPAKAAEPTRAAQPTATAPAKSQPTATAQPGGGQVQSEIAGKWKGTMTINSATLTGVSDADQKSFQSDYAAIKGKPQPIEMEFAATSADAGTVTVQGDKMSYRYQNGQVTFDTSQGGGAVKFQARLSRKDGGYALDGTFQGSGPESGGTLTMEGVWNLTKP